MTLVPVEDGPAVVVCSTCGPSDEGERLLAAMRAARDGDARYAGVEVQAMPCLFACVHACAVHLRAAGKIGYVLGRFAPGEAAATAILDYAVAYAASEEGTVDYGDWPEGVKGHFLTRTPPAGFVVA